MTLYKISNKKPIQLN